jgi:hypothetical protein
MKIILSFLSIFVLTGGLLAQTASDALRFSTMDVGGTARTIGINGAVNALGADYSVLSTNPAGAAAFRRSEFTFSPAISTTQVTSTLQGDKDNFGSVEDRSKFNLSNVGFVFVSRPSSSRWRTVNFGIGLNRIADFHANYFYTGQSAGSITDRWVELADGLTPDQLDAFEAGPAYDVGAIFNPFSYDNTLYTNDFGPDEVVNKSQLVRTTGAINELVFTLAGNYEEKLMIGATVGVPFVRYEETKEYRETDEENANPTFNELTLNEYLRTTGTGINLKLGFIYRPIQMFRIGGAVHTPTSYSLEDQYDSFVEYDFGSGPFMAESPDGFYEYRLATPWRVIGSTAFIFGKTGFLSADVEWVDYSSAAFNFNSGLSLDDQAFEQELNDQILQAYQSAINIRVGGEVAFDILRLRIGYGYLGSPYADDSSSAGQTISGGIGIREQNFFLDLGYQHHTFGETYVPYLVAAANSQAVTNDFLRQKFVLTFGFKL